MSGDEVKHLPVGRYDVLAENRQLVVHETQVNWRTQYTLRRHV